MTYNYDVKTNMLISETRKIQLSPISREEIKKLRMSKSDFLIFKRGKRVYSFEGEKKGISITFKNFQHKCPYCKYFLICPKVTENVPEKLTDENYFESCRIEKYPFILLGYEQPSSFYVWKCEKFVPSSKNNNNVTNKNKNSDLSATVETSKSKEIEIKDSLKKEEESIYPLITETERLSIAFPNRIKNRSQLILKNLIRDISP